MDVRTIVSTEACIICATPRSGSTLLCDLLAGSGVTGRPNSFYRRESIPDFADRFAVPRTGGIDGPTFDRAYLDGVLREGRGSGPVFSLRLMWPSVAEASLRLDALFPGLESDAHRFERAFGRPLYLFLSRGEKVGQAVSRLKAEQSGLWHRNADGSERERSAPPKRPAYDRDRLECFLAETRAHEAEWQGWFGAEGITPVAVTYEELSASPQTILAGVLSAIGRDPARAANVPLRSARMADAMSLDWARRYTAERGNPTGGRQSP